VRAAATLTPQPTVTLIRNPIFGVTGKSSRPLRQTSRLNQGKKPPGKTHSSV
jgi:hypothetical protein